MRALLILATLAAFLTGGWSAVTFLAPVIQADINARTAERVRPLATHQVTVETRGRHVTIAGLADNTGERDLLIAAAKDTVGPVRVIDRLRVLDVASPYAFRASKREDGHIAIAGVVPSEAARGILIDAARDIAGDAPVSADLALAAGLPSDMWIDLAKTAIAALGPLESGTADLADESGTLTGTVDGVDRRTEVTAILEADQYGTWETGFDLILPTASPYRFDATKEPGRLSWTGHAPDDAVQIRIAERAQALGGKGASGTITLADGMPGALWPDMVERGLGSLALLRSGTLMVADTSVTLTGEVENNDDLRRFETTLGDDWQVDISVLSPDPAPRLLITLDRDGAVTFTGRTPKSFATQMLNDMFVGGETGDLLTDGTGDARAWTRAVDALGIIAPRLRSLNARFTNGRLELDGVLKRDFQATEARAALNAAIPAGWQTRIQLRDAPPFPRLTLTKRTGTIRLTGILPAGLSNEDASQRTNAGETDLQNDGDGDPAGWADALSLAARVTTAYDQSETVLSDATVTVDGALAAGQTVGEVRAWASPAVPDDWSLDISGMESQAADGTVRYNFGSDEFEIFTVGYWLPDLDIDPDVATCDGTARAALEAEKITFVTGSAKIDSSARRILSRLAAVVMQCVTGTGLRLEIEGHTDDVGADDKNLTLSEERARTVLSELLLRGVLPTGLSATGFGELRPIADNTTEEGRAANRRIDFRFRE
ncbi:MAG: OmpA family protein [Pseudomonadota bacterium]